MSESRYTKGPWHVSITSGHLGSGNLVKAVASADGINVAWATAGVPEFSANLNMIAAAPDLLEALKDLLRDEAVLDDDDPKLARSRAAARAAIRKAESGQ